MDASWRDWTMSSSYKISNFALETVNYAKRYGKHISAKGQ
jgi:hypothetical protein